VNDILKQRLVGALILLALGVVFWPIIFVGPGAEKTAEQQVSPPPREVSTAEVVDSDQTGIGHSTVSAVDAPVATGEAEAVVNAASDTAPPSPAPEPTGRPDSPSNTVPADTAELQTEEAPEPQPSPQTPNQDAEPMAWTLQVATVSSAETAENLRRQLLEMNQKAYVTTVHSGGKSLYRVSIGPQPDRAELDKLKAGVNARFGVTSIVVRHTP
jgi:DedD protein